MGMPLQPPDLESGLSPSAKPKDAADDLVFETVAFVGKDTQKELPVGAPQTDQAPAVPVLTPVLSVKQRVIVLAFFALFLAEFTHVLSWLFWETSQTWACLSVAVTLYIFKAYFYDPYLLYAAALVSKKVNTNARPPAGVRVAMIATKCPTEPWDMLVRTLEGMLNQDYDGIYDVWIADEKPTEESLAWCKKRGVMVSSRDGINEYHQPGWPRRTRSKEGNLSYFYDKWGYDMYDVVAQFDADHVPAADYLRTVLPAFSDEKVGYAALPSICDANRDACWAGRGRMHLEATHYGIFSAGQNGLVPVCIGSHYVVRTSAVRSIGGIGPELDEDFSTTMNMQAAGWNGTFSLATIAHGDGPVSFEDAVRQEYQWARSLANITLLWWPKVAFNLPVHKLLRIFYLQLFYVFESMALCFCVFAPMVGTLLGPNRLPAGLNITTDLVYRLLIMDILSVGFAYWMRSLGHARPVDAFIIRWEGILFRLTRSYWMLKGVLDSVISYAAGAQLFQFRVTPKGQLNDLPMSPVALAPFYVVSAASAAVFLAVPGVSVLHFWTLVNAVQYAAFALIITALHVYENWNGRFKTAGYIWRSLAVQLPLAAAAGACAYLKGGMAARAASSGMVVKEFNHGTQITLIYLALSVILLGASLALGAGKKVAGNTVSWKMIAKLFRPYRNVLPTIATSPSKLAPSPRGRV